MMRYRAPLWTAALLALSSLLPATQPGLAEAGDDEAMVREVIRGYVEGWRDGDVERLSQVLAGEGRLLWIDDDSGALRTMTFAEALERQRPRPGYGDGYQVLSLTVLDDELASARVWIPFDRGAYIDLLSFQKIDGRWWMVSKQWVIRRGEAAASPPER